MPTPEEQLRNVQQIQQALEDGFRSLTASIQNVAEEIGEATDDLITFNTISKDITRTVKSISKANEDLISNQVRLNKGQLESKKIQQQLEQIQSKKLISQNRLNSLQNELNDALATGRITAADAAIKQATIANLTAETARSAQETIDSFKRQLEEAEKIEGVMGNLGGIVKGLNKVPILGNLINSERVLEKMQKTAAKTKNTFAVMGIGILEIGKSIGKGLTDPLTVLTFFFNAGLKADKQVTDLAKSLGIGKDQANGLRQNFVKYAASTGDAFITTSKLLEAQGELTNELGIAGQYTGKQAEDFTRLTKLMGLSASEAGKLARLSVVNGTSIEATTKSIIKGSAASQRANKISIDQRTILKDVANLSAGILVKFQGNPEALGAAVVQAKALGLTLEEVDKIGESLLNFESSIENELKAELITGKQLNLERARAAALTGDQATLMQEVSSQMGTLEEFQNLNVIAQKSLSEAFGLSRDEVSKMLIEQEKVNKLGDVSKMTFDQQLATLKAQGEPLDSVLYKQIQQQSAQEKFNNAIEKLQDLIGNLVAGPLGQLIDGFVSIASNANLIKIAMGALMGMSITRLVTGLAAMVIPLITGAAASVTMMSALTLGVGAIAILGSIAAISSSMNKSKEEMSQVNDGIAPSSKGPFTITDRFGATAITADGDGLAVSPNISRSNNINNTSTDLSPIVSIMSEVKASIDRLYSKDTSINMDGKKVGTTLTQGSYKLA
jgi:hypothetical protein